MSPEEISILSEVTLVKRFIAETTKENVIDLMSWNSRLHKLNEELEQLRTIVKHLPQIVDKIDIL
jgi:hypothetical protein